MSKFTKYNDPGHGWVGVGVSVLKSLGIADKISTFSYLSKNGITAFLEEDGDHALFHFAYRLKFGEFPTYDEEHTNGDSFVRSLPHYPGSGSFESIGAFIEEARAKIAEEEAMSDLAAGEFALDDPRADKAGNLLLL